MHLARSRSSILLLALSLTLPSLALAPSPLGADEGGGQVLADRGFRPAQHGFNFPNWGGQEHPDGALTADEAAMMLGDGVCARLENESCVPTPAAKMWVEAMNKQAEGGHCEGLAALSAAFYRQPDSAASFGGTSAYQLSVQDSSLLRAISGYFSTQFLGPVKAETEATRQWPLQKIVDFLVTALAEGSDYPTLGIYGAAGGHAVTPYKVESRGQGLYRIYIYDNNYPGDEKFIDVDVPKDHWVYAGAALNPSEAAAAWQGGTGSMDTTLLSWRHEQLECPFCGSGPSPAAPAGGQPSSRPTDRPATPPAQRPAPRPTQGPGRRPAQGPATVADTLSISTSALCSQVVVTSKRDGKQMRMGERGLESQIPGASMRALRGSHGCAIELPRNLEVDIQLRGDGGGASQPPTDMVVFGPGSAFAVDDVALRPGATETLSVGPQGYGFAAGSPQRPRLRVANDGPGANPYYEVSGVSLDAGQHFGAERTDDGRIAFDCDGGAFDVHAEVVGPEETTTHDFDDVEAGEHGQVLLDVDDEGHPSLAVDSDSDGSGDSADLDDDNDGTPDAADLDDDGDGTPDTAEQVDADHDGQTDNADLDDDNDGTPDAADLDDDGDGTADTAEQVDGDDEGHADDAEVDADHDGQPDEADVDADHDGQPDDADIDADHDGQPDDTAVDEEDDGHADDAEVDADHDGQPDDAEIDEDDGGQADDTAVDEEDADQADEPADESGDEGGDEGGGDEGGDERV